MSIHTKLQGSKEKLILNGCLVWFCLKKQKKNTNKQHMQYVIYSICILLTTEIRCRLLS